ncbi:T-cell surface glycoprotein CD3 gamma chain isoform X2 [Microcaecilia unicolor]|uniref:T-cell surface glycoprotein CD3 gamma chain-like isoform X2 n=1 Tax=Microcaecilia unicolor TaxID=1415580 RepID=A0A6P7ZUW7_9AMPH|nr:T-cell surface glycoprotein CD3 gamma chain-like isoform X2 [Microcaecilia unicolor]
MKIPKHVIGVIILSFLFKDAVSEEPEIKLSGGKVTLYCKDAVTWFKDGKEVLYNKTDLDLGSETDDPRGMYECQDRSTKKHLQVYYRMCQSCIEFNTATISGLVIADVIATVLIAFAVYCVTSPDKGRSSQASDKQTLIRNEQLYQPLRDRDNSEYSHLSTARPRK